MVKVKFTQGVVDLTSGIYGFAARKGDKEFAVSGAYSLTSDGTPVTDSPTSYSWRMSQSGKFKTEPFLSLVDGNRLPPENEPLDMGKEYRVSGMSMTHPTKENLEKEDGVFLGEIVRLNITASDW